ncbi:MAG: hypothetical protein NC078_00180 [Ruminococcus sp.]|nr:hypothetical protein [Ruminococcus sp.]
MKKAMKTFLALFLSVAVAIPAMTANVSAEEFLYNLTAAAPSGDDDGISPHTNYMPDTPWDFSNGMYHADGKAVESASLYTNYYFTGVTSLAISITNRGNNAITVKLRSRGLINNSHGSFVVSAYGDASKVFTNLDPDKQYFFEFTGPCDFSAYIA